MSDSIENEMGSERELGPQETLRHSAAHLMASAISEMWPGTKFGIGTQNH